MEAIFILADILGMVALCISLARADRQGNGGLGIFDFKRDQVSDKTGKQNGGRDA